VRLLLLLRLFNWLVCFVVICFLLGYAVMLAMKLGIELPDSVKRYFHRLEARKAFQKAKQLQEQPAGKL
jgi:hypothetical protein